MNTRTPAKPAPKEGFIGLRFGVFAPPLKEQLKGYRVSGDDVDHFQKDANAISRLRIRSLITDSQADKAHEKLMKNIVGAIPKGKKAVAP